MAGGRVWSIFGSISLCEANGGCVHYSGLLERPDCFFGETMVESSTPKGHYFFITASLGSDSHPSESTSTTGYFGSFSFLMCALWGLL